MATTKEQAWEQQERIDAEIAGGFSKSRNMLDFVEFNNVGKPFMTLAGLMKVANGDHYKISTEVCDATWTEQSVHVLVKVTTKPDEDGWQQNAYGSRTETYRDPKSGQIDQYAYTRAVNIAVRCAAKTLLYGDGEIENLLTEFAENNTFEPEKVNGNGNGKPKQQPKQTVQQPPPKQEEAKPANQDVEIERGPALPKNYHDLPVKEQSLAQFEFYRPTLDKINNHLDPANKEFKNPTNNVFKDFLLIEWFTTPDFMVDDHFEEVIKELNKPGMGAIGQFYMNPPDGIDVLRERHQKAMEENKKHEQQKPE